MLQGRWFRRTESNGKLLMPACRQCDMWLAEWLATSHNLQLFYFCVFVQICWFVMAGFACQMPVIFHKRGTLTPPAFKNICHRRNVSFFWGIWALCAAAWVNVAEACPFMEYSGSGTETVRQPTHKTQTQNNCTPSYLLETPQYIW